MEIKRVGSQPSAKGPSEWFTGTVRWIRNPCPTSFPERRKEDIIAIALVKYFFDFFTASQRLVVH
jgi:hypothetical protein